MGLKQPQGGVLPKRGYGIKLGVGKTATTARHIVRLTGCHEGSVRIDLGPEVKANPDVITVPQTDSHLCRREWLASLALAARGTTVWACSRLSRARSRTVSLRTPQSARVRTRPCRRRSAASARSHNTLKRPTSSQSVVQRPAGHRRAVAQDSGDCRAPFFLPHAVPAVGAEGVLIVAFSLQPLGAFSPGSPGFAPRSP